MVVLFSAGLFGKDAASGALTLHSRNRAVVQRSAHPAAGGLSAHSGRTLFPHCGPERAEHRLSTPVARFTIPLHSHWRPGWSRPCQSGGL